MRPPDSRSSGAWRLCALIAALLVSGCSHEVVPTPAYNQPAAIPAPSRLEIRPGCFGTLIQWEAPDSDFVVVQGWYVYKRRPDGEVVRLTPTPSKQRSYIDGDESDEGTTAYWATALSRGGVESLKSNVASFSIVLGQLAPPTDLTGTVLNQRQVLLQWRRGSPLISGGYHIFRDGERYAQVRDPDMPAFVDTAVLPAHTYRYTVTAVDCRDTDGQPTPEVSVTTPP